MKKLLTVLLIATLLFSFTACGKKAKDKNVSDDPAISVTDPTSDDETQKTDKNPFETEEIVDEDIVVKEAETETEKGKEPKVTNKPENKSEKTDEPKNSQVTSAPEKAKEETEKTGTTPVPESTPSLPGSKDAPIELEEIPDW